MTHLVWKFVRFVRFHTQTDQKAVLLNDIQRLVPVQNRQFCFEVVIFLISCLYKLYSLDTRGVLWLLQLWLWRKRRIRCNLALAEVLALTEPVWPVMYRYLHLTAHSSLS